MNRIDGYHIAMKMSFKNCLFFGEKKPYHKIVNQAVPMFFVKVFFSLWKRCADFIFV